VKGSWASSFFRSLSSLPISSSRARRPPWHFFPELRPRGVFFSSATADHHAHASDRTLDENTESFLALSRGPSLLSPFPAPSCAPKH
jgi:hypothetical protein